MRYWSRRGNVNTAATGSTDDKNTGRVIVTPIATVVIEALKEKTGFRAPHYVALAIGVLGFLAIIVLWRAGLRARAGW
jgi:hypothetical protein